jgi:hypothetical protein
MHASLAPLMGCVLAAAAVLALMGCVAPLMACVVGVACCCAGISIMSAAPGCMTKNSRTSKLPGQAINVAAGIA